MRLVLSILCAVLPLAACSSEPPVQSGMTLPLRIEARKHDGKYALFLNDEAAPTSPHALKVALEQYADVVDAGAGMKGHDPYVFYSENRVIFHAPPDAPTELFVSVMELLVDAIIVKVWVELRRDGLAPLQCSVELPRDESLGPQRDYALRLEASSFEANGNWKVYMNGNRLQLENGKSVSVPLVKNWTAESLRFHRESLLAAVADVSDGLRYYDAGVVWTPSGKLPAWGHVYQVVAAICELNDRRREQRSIINVWAGEISTDELTEPPEKPFDLPPVEED